MNARRVRLRTRRSAREAQRELGEFVPEVALGETFDHAVDAGGLQQGGAGGAGAEALGGGADGVLARAEDLGFFQRAVGGQAAVHGGADLREGAGFGGEGPEDQHRRSVFGAQALQQAGAAAAVAGQYGGAQFVDIEAGDIEHGVFHLGQGQCAGRMQQAEFLDFLMRGEQIAFNVAGDEFQRVLRGGLLLA